MKTTNVIKKERKHYNQKLEDIFKYNKEHKDDLQKSVLAGCYYCCKIYEAISIEEWCVSTMTKEQRGQKHLLPEDCAICPNCGIDSVLPDSKVGLSVEMLKDMHDYWFGDCCD